MKFIKKAAIWETDRSGPCAQCGGPGGHAYVLEQEDQANTSFCDSHCWGRWWDLHVQLEGEPPARVEPPMPWEPIVWAHALDVWGKTNAGELGITRHTRRNLQYLLYRDTSGQLLGLLRRNTAGGYQVLVDPNSRHQGIGKALMRAAGREWGVNDAAQQFTADGAHLSNRIHPGRK